ncbi:hypothetical protein GCK72_007512 [Caenorhabditis remanei]|uniref:Protein kinase domain-containing protein n=1 Tax=Caenorhabditis remanei TaxID=31234 RepID=A0A6A5HMG3_CAERE|nr:hypothetical protein GCK72_007512 [Caenorhabditis remanei]KAF1767553.1 hypothetical protein GCK72_007512 [Caenorhabditis remanei]
MSSSPPPASPPPTDSTAAPAPPSSTGTSSNPSKLLPLPPVRSAEYIPDKAEYETEEEELVNLGVFEFRGASYRIKKMLGEGTYGKVALVAAESRKLFAAKFFVKDNKDAEDNDESIGVEERVS